MLEIVIRWVPAQGQFMVKWPDGVDEVVKLGMVELAKATLVAQVGQPKEKPLVEVPQVRLA